MLFVNATDAVTITLPAAAAGVAGNRIEIVHTGGKHDITIADVGSIPTNGRAIYCCVQVAHDTWSWKNLLPTIGLGRPLNPVPGDMWVE
jgi:hypothetical protein